MSEPERKPGEAGTPEAAGREESTTKSFARLAKYTQIGFILPAAVVVGLLLGMALDRWLHTTWIYIVGLVLGMVAGFVELIRTVNSMQKEK